MPNPFLQPCTEPMSPAAPQQQSWTQRQRRLPAPLPRAAQGWPCPFWPWSFLALLCTRWSVRPPWPLQSLPFVRWDVGVSQGSAGAYVLGARAAAVLGAELGQLPCYSLLLLVTCGLWAPCCLRWFSSLQTYPRELVRASGTGVRRQLPCTQRLFRHKVCRKR